MSTAANNDPIRYESLQEVGQYFREEFTREGGKQKKWIMLFAYNGTGKTRLSMAFKELGKDAAGNGGDTLYFNAFTEDLFVWNNDLENNTHRYLQLNMGSKFFEGLQQLDLNNKIKVFLHQYVDLLFDIDYDTGRVVFTRTMVIEETEQTIENIKISRGEENLFIWCFFLALCQLVIDGDEAYSWVKYIYIDDPISSLDDNNIIALACDLAKLIRTENNPVKTVISTHHSLFYNIMYNELGKGKKHKYCFLHNHGATAYLVKDTGDTPFFHHIAILSQLKEAEQSDELYTYHFNALRTILEKTASFFGYKDIKRCLEELEADEFLFNRILNLLSHGKYSLFEPVEMVPDNKILFKEILDSFLEKYDFYLPSIFSDNPPTT
ncbi:MAG: AAA family ATPase [Aureispira sp.]